VFWNEKVTYHANNKEKKGIVMKTRLVVSEATNPWFNLAYEEQLVNTVEPDEIILYLWQNAHTVVIGKHQNPWREVRVDLLEEEGGKLARRLSGGGAVYHDLGNLNFTFVMHKKHENLEKQLSVLLGAVRQLDIEAYFSGRNDLLVGEQKFSGNAFYHGKDNYYHHGTLLVDVDLEHLGKYLNASVKKLNAKGVTSVKSRVVNLKTINPEITIPSLMASLEASFVATYGPIDHKEYISEATISGTAISRYEHYASWDWRYGKTPSFDAVFEEKFQWGEIALNFKTEKGSVSEVGIFSDAMSTAFVDALKPIFVASPFDKESLYMRLDSASLPEGSEQMRADLLGWLRSLEIA
jgi:lipoate-protein ligase A